MKIRFLMEGEKRKKSTRGKNPTGANSDSGLHQEYDFFVPPYGSGSGSEETVFVDQPVEEKEKKPGRSKSVDFFLSD